MAEIIRSVKDLKVYNLAYELAMEIFEIAKNFPKEEMYSLTDQIRRSSRSVAINIREGFAKRKYEQVFIRHLNDALGSSEETRGWLKFSLDCKYISQEQQQRLDSRYDEVNAMLFTLMNNWESREQVTENGRQKTDNRRQETSVI
jgi:four helix bundle protein